MAPIGIGLMACERDDTEGAETWRWTDVDLGDMPTLLWLAPREPDPDPGENHNVALMT